MELFRITRKKYKNDYLSGSGAGINGGRWNEIETPILYTSQSRSLALVEILVHLEIPEPPADIVLIVIYIPDSTFIETISSKQLSQKWKNSVDESRTFGTKWAKAESSLALKVPSVVVRNEYNVLLNCRHEDFGQVKVIDTEKVDLDRRLFGLY
jgi:RES domain-containing protein